MGSPVRGVVLLALLTALFVQSATAEESGRTQGTVVKSGETLTVKTKEGTEETFFVKQRKKGEKWVRDQMPSIALKKTLRKGMELTVDWSIGEGGRKYINKLSATGSVTGTVVAPRERGILLLEVEGIQGPMRFVSRWIRREGRWMPDPKEVELFASMETGAKVTVTYKLEEHFRVDQLTPVAKE